MVLRLVFLTTPAITRPPRCSTNDSFPHCATAFNLRFPLGLVHVFGLAADERLVSFDRAFQLLERPVLHRQSNAMQYVPRALLSDTKSAAEFVAADAVLSIRYAPDGDKPLVQSKR